MLLCGLAIAQDPVNPNEEAETVCEPIFRVNYAHDAQTMTIFYEDCEVNHGAVLGCCLCCGICGVSPWSNGGKRNMNYYSLVATDIYGKVIYQEDQLYDKPSELTVTGLNLEKGAYFLRMIKPGGETITHKFGVR